jgi:glycosyltransferase involved in cell wall biosynthesis
MKKILHISPDFNYSCGVSKLVYLTLLYFNDKEDYECHFITNGGDSLERLDDLTKIKIRVNKFSRGIKNIFFAKNFYKNVKEYCKDSDINLIHTYHRFPEYIATRVSRETKIKSVGTVLSFVNKYKKLSFRSDHLITVSNAITSHLVNKFHIEPKKITTMYLPNESLNESQDIYLKTNLGIEDHKKVLLFMGRINFIKNIDNLLKAYKIVNKHSPDTLLLLCGNVESEKIKDQIKNVKAPIKVLEPRKNNQLLYQLADIVVLPSRVDPLPFVMVESGAFKKPFIGGNTGGIAEFIEDGKNGLLADPENPEQLAEKIVYLLNNPEIGKILGENLFEKVSRLCDYNNYFNEVEKIYNSLLTS